MSSCRRSWGTTTRSTSGSFITCARPPVSCLSSGDEPATAMLKRLSFIAPLCVAAMVALDARDLQRPAEPTDPMNTVVHPAALAKMIDDIGGRRVLVTKARVIAVLNPRVFLIESDALLPPLAGNLDRVLVLVDRGM